MFTASSECPLADSIEKAVRTGRDGINVTLTNAQARAIVTALRLAWARSDSGCAAPIAQTTLDAQEATRQRLRAAMHNM
jgi:hypothetical protein